jgi:3-oxoadipate enol-lactonase
VPFADLSDVQIYYQWDGPKDKPVVVLSNGLGTDVTLWDGQIPELVRLFRVLRYDHRGHGQSSVPPDPYSIEMLSRDALALLDRVGVQRCFFCGLSMGGAVGQWLGVNAANRLDKLVLSNTAARIGSQESWNTRIALVREGGVEAALPLVLDRWFTPKFKQAAPDVAARTREMLLATKPDGYIGGCAAVRDLDLREAVKSIGLRTLVITGDQDTSTPPAEGRYLAESIAGARHVELPAAHLSNVEACDQFNSVILDFLTA